MVLVLPQFANINGNDVLRASQLIKRFRRSGDANNHNIRIFGGLADGVARNAGEVRLRAVCGKNDDVMCLVADDDLKASGEIRVVLYPYTEPSIGGNYDFFWWKFSPGDAAPRRFNKEGIGQREGFVLRKTKVAVLGVDKE